MVDIISTQLGYLSPEDIVVREYPEPETESEKLDIRVASILRQIIGNSAIDSNESVVIAPISPSEPSLKEIADYVWNLSVEKFAELSTASVIERKRLEDVLAELELDMAGLTDSENRSSAVKLLDAESILLSEVQYLGSIRICHMRLVDIKTGKVRSAARVKL